MNIQFWSIGKQHENYVLAGINEFTKRISNYFTVSWKIIPSPKNAGQLLPADLKRKEADIILKSLSSTDYLIALDERGKMMASADLAQFLQVRSNESIKQVIFLIGGAFGIDESVIQRANFQWSLSPLTFPHQLVRLILAEQVYRGCTILRNEKYHHS